MHFVYWPKGQGQSGDVQKTAVYSTIAEEAFTARLVADQVEPGKQYDYQLWINDQAVELSYPTTFQTQELWQWRTDPPEFTVALGSCTYINESVYDRPGRPYGSNYSIFDAIHERRPDAMIWLGDNIYLREVDWYSMTGIQARYTHTRSVKPMQPLLANIHHYAIWDDHDYGPNDSDRSYVHKNKTLATFQQFWGNPSYGVNEQGGITSFFQWADMEFFLLDNRYFRSPNHRESGEATILGEDQLEWLIDALAASRAPFKMVVIGGQVLNTAPLYETYVNLAPDERAYLLGQIERENIKGVIFLTGDRHHTELSHYVNNQGNAVYDLTISPLTSGVGRGADEDNRLRVPGTYVGVHNFGLLTFRGPRQERELLIQVMDKGGQELWRQLIKQD